MKMKHVLILLLVLCLTFIIYIKPLHASEELTPSGIPLSDLETRVDDYVKEYIGQTTAGASVLVMKNHETVFSKGYGLSDIENNHMMQPEQTIMEWGSISKLFVWVAAMQMVEQAELDLNEDIQTYLPDDFLTKLSYDEPITMLHLMNHNAGFEENIFDLGFASADRVTSLEQGLQLAEPHQVYKPGQVVAYSNYSTSLAAYIIERITDEPFYEYVQKNILEPLNMKQTIIHPTFNGQENLLENKAKGYVLSSPEHFVESDWFYMSMYPSGAVNGTAEDLSIFADALLPKEGEISPLFTKEETLETLLSQSYSANEHVSGIAHGLWEYAGASRGVTHGGNTTSFSSNLHLVPEEEFAVIVLTNQAGEMDINYGLTALLVGESEPQAAVEDLPNTEELEGSFLAARRPHHSFISLYFFLMPYQVKPIQENEIEINYAGFTANYVQTSPYVYEMSHGDTIFYPMKQLSFQVENGKVQQISTSISDYLPLPAGKTTPILNAYMVLAIVCVLYFLVAPLILVIKAIINKMKKRRSSQISIWHAVLVVCGTATLVNIIALVIRMLSSYDRAYAEVAPQILLNGFFSVIALLSMAFMAWRWPKSRLLIIQKITYSITISMTVLLITLLLIWGFYG